MSYPIFLVLAAVMQCIQAAKVPTAQSQEICLTSYASTSGPVSTTTIAYTLTFHPTVVVAVQPSTTITPPASTATETSLVTSTSTLPQATDTFTETTTETDVSTETDTTKITSHTLVLSTTTLAPTVSTIPAPTGFIYPSPSPGAPQKRDLASPIARNGGALIERKAAKNLSPHCANSPLKYPSLVKCYELVETFIPTTITRTKGHTSTITAPTPVTTVTDTETTVTITTQPDASTTVTESTTTTTTQTTVETDVVTQTDTSTVTYNPPPSSTYYAACGPSNQVSKDYQGRLLEFEQAYVPSSDTNTNTAYDCCALCFKTPNCYGSNWGTGFSQSCELQVGSTCPAGQGGSGGLYTYDRGGPSLTFSNGPCGTYNYQESV